MNTSTDQKVSIPLAIIIAGALIAAAVFFGGSRTAATTSLKNPTNSGSSSATVEAVNSNDHILGSPDSKIVIVEYSDLECPFCKVFHDTMHKIVNDYKGEVAWVYRHFPIAQLHSRASKEAEATECAAEQGGNEVFWKYMDKIFATTGSNNTLDPAELPKIASELGLDVTAFNSCLSSGKYTAAIQNDVNAAIKAGAQGTPYSVILTKDGKKIPLNGALPYETVKSTIDSLLK